MRYSRPCFGLILAGWVTATSACGDFGIGPLSPTNTAKANTYQASGDVRDDDCLLPGGVQPCSPLDGVQLDAWVEYERSVFAMTGPDGKFSLGPLPVEGQVCNIIAGCSPGSTYVTARKEGWTAVSQYVSSRTNLPMLFTLGREPHVLWGQLSVPGSQPAGPAADVRVEIVGGTNAGRVALTDSAGLYRFDDLRTSGGFQIELSATGYQTSRHYGGELKTNARFDMTLSK